MRSVVVSLRQMGNEPYFVPVTFGLIDHKGPSNTQGRFLFNKVTWH